VGQFSTATAALAAQEAMRLLGAVGRPSLLSMSSAVTFVADGATWRVIDPALGLGVPLNELQAAGLLIAGGVRTPRPQTLAPIVTNTGIVTVWEFIPRVQRGSWGLAGWFGQQIKALPTAGLNPAGPWRRISEYLNVARAGELLGAVDLDDLTARRDDLIEQWAQHSTAPVCVHGDLNLGNVLTTPDGPVVLDLEDVGVGPVEWEVSPALITAKRYGAEGSVLDDFTRAYGQRLDPRMVEVALAARTLMSALWYLSGTQRSDAFAPEEAALRIRVALGSGTGIFRPNPAAFLAQ
jgi:hypothetical protein